MEMNGGGGCIYGLNFTFLGSGQRKTSAEAEAFSEVLFEKLVLLMPVTHSAFPCGCTHACGFILMKHAPALQSGCFFWWLVNSLIVLN